MSEVTLTLVPKSAAPPKQGAPADVLARALAGRTAVSRKIQVQGRQASPQEGLTLVADFLAIADPELRQAVLDAVATLAGPIA